MREILFRGKRVGAGEWVEGYYLKAKYHWHNRGIHEDWIVSSAIQNGGTLNLCVRYAVVHNTVGQYTGLTDKNGKRIFKGDILYVHDRLLKAADPFHEFIGYVDYKDNSFVIVKDEWAHYRWSCYEIKVIGNIHDNPELAAKL